MGFTPQFRACLYKRAVKFCHAAVEPTKQVISTCRIGELFTQFREDNGKRGDGMWPVFMQNERFQRIS